MHLYPDTYIYNKYEEKDDEKMKTRRCERKKERRKESKVVVGGEEFVDKMWEPLGTNGICIHQTKKCTRFSVVVVVRRRIW